MSDKPNVLVLFTDDQRFDTIAALCNSAIKTPNIDRLAARGTSFTRAHIMGGSSGAVCMPSRAMLHTGRTLYQIEGQGQRIAANHTMLGEHLQAAGYHTWGCGKWHNSRPAFNRAFADGQSIYFGGMCDHWNVPGYRYDPTGKYEDKTPRCIDPLHTDELIWGSGNDIQPGQHSSDLLSQHTVNFIQDVPRDKPWFAYTAFLAPHDPRTMPQEFMDMYDPDQIELPDNYMPVHPFDNGELTVRDEMLEAFPRTAEAIRKHIAAYYAMITHLDHGIGRILDALDASGQADNTIIVFAGDNGLAVGRHGLLGKQSLYEHSVRVPLIMAGPGIAQGEQRDSLCYLLDIFPTLCDLLDLPKPDSVQGQSLASVLADANKPHRELLHLAYRNIHRAVTDGDHKLIAYHVGGCRRTQLFDLKADPCEMNDLSNDPGLADKRERLTGELLKWRSELGDDREGQGADFWVDWPGD